MTDGPYIDRPAATPVPAGAADFTRRRLIQGAAAFGAGGALLAACGGSSKTGTGTGTGTSASAGFATSSGGGTPVRGGTLRIGVITGGTAETVNPGVASVWPDIIRTYQLFDRLFENAAIGTTQVGVVPGLALSAESSADAKVWRVHLRPNVTFHDGKPLTADDVMWTISTWAKATNYASSYAVGRVDFQGVRKLDSLTVEIPLIDPLAEFPSVLSQYNFGIIQNGATAKQLASHPVGTGPFQFVSFTPGTQSVFTANKNYWQSGKPYVDTVVIDTSYTDEATRQNALASGQLDGNIFAAPTWARSQQGSNSLTILVGGVPGANGGALGAAGVAFVMRVDKPPFNDVRVRQAFKLMLNRPSLIDSVYDGFGAVGNDTWGFGARNFDSSLVPSYDPEKAKSLLKAAGQSALATTIETSDATEGYVGAATLLSQQASLVSVKVTVDQIAPTIYFTPNGGFLIGTLRQDEGAEYPSMSTAYLSFLAKGAPYPDTHWTDTGIIAQAMAATDPAKAQDLWYEAQRQQATQGGTILWVNEPYIDAVAKYVHGVEATVAGPMNNYRLLDAWIDKS